MKRRVVAMKWVSEVDSDRGENDRPFSENISKTQESRLVAKSHSYIDKVRDFSVTHPEFLHVPHQFETPWRVLVYLGGPETDLFSPTRKREDIFPSF